MDEQEQRRPGRPKGSKNKPKEPMVIIHTPPGFDPTADYRYADPTTLVARQFALIDWAQQAKRNEMQSGMQAGGTRLDNSDVKALMDLSNALLRNLEALKKASDRAEELAKRKSPEELLEIAIKKIEGQSRAMQLEVIKRLRLSVARLAPINANEALKISGGRHQDQTASEAIADLSKDLDNEV